MGREEGKLPEDQRASLEELKDILRLPRPLAALRLIDLSRPLRGSAGRKNSNMRSHFCAGNATIWG
jgi:hypothetical protein